jgi:hypothetical protein
MVIGVSLLASSVCSVSSRIDERIGLSLDSFRTDENWMRSAVKNHLRLVEASRACGHETRDLSQRC